MGDVMTKARDFALDPETEARMQRLAIARRLPTDALVRVALEQYVAREERRDGMEQEALLAWKAFEDDGLHATGEEVDAWLARLEAGEDVAPPECHV